jgi:HTH-type transcriptional regulator/antitoxin HigA
MIVESKVIPIDRRKYGRLLARTLPVVVETEEENERLLEEVNQLMSKGEGNLSPEEMRLLHLLVRLIEDFEETAYPFEPSPPHEMIQHLMENRGLKQADLLAVLGSRGVTSEVVNGKRRPSKEQAKRLAEFFNVSVELFI